MTTLGVVGFIVALLVSVTLHEGGHFVTARMFGMKASKFFVGFGPTVWSFRRGETEYGIKAIPAGGFVKIEGMTPLEEVQPGDEGRAFWKFPARQRAVVLSAGSFMHFVLAIFLVYGVVATAGVFDDNAPVVGPVSVCVPQAPDGKCSDPGSVPAPAAHVFQTGDRIMSIDGARVRTWEDAITHIRGGGGKPLSVVVRRDGHPVSLQLTPVVVTRPSLDDPHTNVSVGAVGVSQGIAYKHYGPIAAVGQTGQALGHMVSGTFTVLTHKLSTLGKVYSKDRDPEGFAGAIGIARVSGDILSFQQESFGHRLADFLSIVAGVNLFVGIFNLFPLLPLDGGHLAISGFEEGRHRIRRLFGYRGALRRVDLNKLMPVTYAFVVLLAGLTIYIAGADIVNPIKLTQ
jgi:membrane-associated protease RseP (regulator of RpoE activity)